MIKKAIAKVVRGDNLTEEEMEVVMGEVMTGNATPAQIGSFITALRIKGETVDEITGAARTMRAKAEKIYLNNHMVNPIRNSVKGFVSTPNHSFRKSSESTSSSGLSNGVNVDRAEINAEDETILDTCGTGGDSTNTFNVSTATAFVVAGAGVKVAKHGNRAVSSHCGSADVIEALDLKLDIASADVEKCIRTIGIGFLFAPLFHRAMKHAAGPRREIGIRTIFNLLGPVTNPAGATAQLLGVYALDLTEKMAHVLEKLGTREAFVVCGEGTFDEISICGPTRVSHLKEGKVTTFEMTPEEHGFKRAAPEAIRGGSARENAHIIQAILDGEKGSKRDMVLLNASAAFVAAGLDSDFKEGIERAKDSIDSGRAREKLDALVSFTQKCAYFVRKEL